MIKDLDFKIGEIVFLITDNEQSARMVTGYTVRLGYVIYHISCGTVETSHYSIELASDKNFL